MNLWIRLAALSGVLSLALGGVGQAAVLTSGTIPLGGPLDVYFQVVEDPAGTPNFCPTGPLSNCFYQGSEAISKVDSEGQENNPGFPYSGQTFDVDALGNPSGTWSYTLGLGDPQFFVTAWITKGGSDVTTEHYLVLDGHTDYTAIAATPGPDYPWLSFDIKNNDNACQGSFEPIPINGDFLCLSGLSNITFLDSEGGPPSEIPEPGSLALLGAALLALLGLTRRRKI
jgi:hypothetical protein